MFNTAFWRKYLPKKTFPDLKLSALLALLIFSAIITQQIYFKSTTEALATNIFTAAGITIFKNSFSIPNDNSQSVLTSVLITSSPVITIAPSTSPTPTISPTPTAINTPNPQLVVKKAGIPAEIINLSNWKLTLPFGEAKHPTEIKLPSLLSYVLDPFFVVSVDGSGVRFRAPVNGVTTSNSGYPRSELREMTNNGTTNASWSSTSGTHTLFLDQAITKFPETKKHVVAGQIHDASDDVLVIRLEYPNLYVNVDGKNLFTLDPNYILGKRFTIKFEVSSGKTKVFYNNQSSPAYVLDKAYSGAYFKTGAYTQSNCTKESSSLCNADNYGEVIVYQATVSHQ